MDTTLTRFGQSVAAARKAKGLTQADLAVDLGISRTYVGLVETGKAKNVTLRLATEIAAILGPAVRLDADASRVELVEICETLLQRYAAQVYDLYGDERPEPGETDLIKRATALLSGDAPPPRPAPAPTVEDLLHDLDRQRGALNVTVHRLVGALAALPSA